MFPSGGRLFAHHKAHTTPCGGGTVAGSMRRSPQPAPRPFLTIAETPLRSGKKGRLEHTCDMDASARSCASGMRVFLRLHDDLILSCGYDVDRLLR